MGRALRSKRERAVLYRAAGGKCVHCGCELPVDWHADHIIPWVVSRSTSTKEMQALCPACNLSKGSKMIVLRGWQSRAWKICQASTRDFFLEATPGAGKTKFACHVASRKLASGSIEKIVVVCPTVALKKQWAEDLHSFGIDAEKDYQSGAWPKDFQAICVTYGQVSNDTAMLSYFCGMRRTLVIFDEVHHCSTDARWGDAIQHAFADASFRLSLTGTPFRSDSVPIPFLRYIDGKAKADFQYGYGEGLKDNVCRHVFFPRQGGKMEWATPSGSMRSKTFDDDIAESEANQRLRTALTTGGWLKETIRDAWEKLRELREEDHDAGGLVVAMDQSHAKRVARMVTEVTGTEPVVVLSDDPEAQEKIGSYKTASSPWIVAVKMVSEGIDIPRLRVGVYATNTLTEMFFRQVVGRFVRVQHDHEDHTASVFIPDDQRLRQFAETIRQQRIHELEEELDRESRRQERAEDEGNDMSYFMPLNSNAEHKGTIVDEFTFSESELEEARDIANGMVHAEIAAAMLRRFKLANGLVESAPPDNAKRPMRSDRRKELRQTNSSVARAIAHATGREFSHVNSDLNRSAGIPSIKNATIEQLELRLKFAEALLKGARNVSY